MVQGVSVQRDRGSEDENVGDSGNMGVSGNISDSKIDSGRVGKRVVVGGRVVTKTSKEQHQRKNTK
jgi:hypothetical protein